MQASGPGEVRLMQKGGAEGGFEAPGAPRPEARKAPPRPGEKKDEEMKLTYISFHEKMTANKKKNLAIFYGVAHLKDMDKRLTQDMGFKRTNMDYRVAWDLSPRNRARTDNANGNSRSGHCMTSPDAPHDPRL